MRSIFVTLGIAVGIMVASLALPDTTSAAVNVFEKPCPGGSTSAICADKASGKSSINTIINLIFYAVGIIAVIVIIVAGIKFITADGDASKIKSARETIMYAVIGLVVALMAYAIVGFIIGRV